MPTVSLDSATAATMQSAIYPVRKPLDHDAPRCASRDTLVAPGLTVALAVPVALPRHWPHSGPKWPSCPQSTRRKLSLLQLGQELGNVSKAGRLMVYHRDALCEVRAPSRSAAPGARLAAPRPRGPHPTASAPRSGAHPRLRPRVSHLRRPAREQPTAPGGADGEPVWRPGRLAAPRPRAQVFCGNPHPPERSTIGPGADNPGPSRRG